VSTSATRQLCEHVTVPRPKPQPADPIAPLVEALLKELGEDAKRPGLKATPTRVARALR
jgi:GTP cyclohydrolase I